MTWYCRQQSRKHPAKRRNNTNCVCDGQDSAALVVGTWLYCRARQGEKSRRARAERMLRRFVSTLSRSGEPSGNVGSSLVICVKRPQSSVRVRRISSVSVSTRIVSSIIFDRANRGLLTEALRRRRRLHRLRPKRQRRSAKHLRPSADERCDKA